MTSIKTKSLPGVCLDYMYNVYTFKYIDNYNEYRYIQNID